MTLKNKMTLKKIISEIVSLVIIVVVVFAFKSSFIANYTVPTGSMRPIIEIGDKLIVDKMAYNLRIPFTDISLYEFGKPQRGDVVVFESPYDSSETFVKRLIGLPGDLIEVENGVIAINGKPVEVDLDGAMSLTDIVKNGGLYKETLNGKTYTVRRIPNCIRMPSVQVRVPQGQYFMMGDNRCESKDSRRFGFIAEKKIWGKAKFIYFSFDWPKVRWERIGNTF